MISTRLALVLVFSVLWSEPVSATVWSWSFESTTTGQALRLRGVWQQGCDPEDATVSRNGTTLTLVARFPVASCGANQILEKSFPVSGDITGASELRIFYALAPAFSPAIWHYTSVDGLQLPLAWNCRY